MSDYPMHCAPRCGARTRSGNPCRAPAIRGKARCRMHGGKSPGRPVIHGRYTKATIERRRRWRRQLRELNALLDKVEGKS
jgi:hypothetical protein